MMSPITSSLRARLPSKDWLNDSMLWPGTIVAGLISKLASVVWTGLIYYTSKIAWSRFGCIANIASNGRRLDLRLLVRSPKTGEWRLQKPTSVRLACSLIRGDTT